MHIVWPLVKWRDSIFTVHFTWKSGHKLLGDSFPLGSPSFSSYSSRTPEPPANYLSIMLGMAGRSCESGSHSAALPRLAHFSAAAASLSRTQYPPFCSLQLTPDYPWSCHHSAGSLKDALQGMQFLPTACRQPDAVSGAHMRLTSACGLTSRLDAQGQLRVQLSGKNPRQLHHELADHHHQARQTLPGIGGCVVAAQTHFRSPSLLPSIISSHIHTHF